MPIARLTDIVEVLPPQPSAPPAPPAPTGVQGLISAAARKHNVPEEDLFNMARQESGFKPDALSPKGAIGVMQLMPGTAKDLGVDPYNVEQNIDGGARYYRQMLDRFGGDRTKARAAYNAGPGAVERYGGVPPYAETQNYVKATAPAQPTLLAQNATPAATAAPPTPPATWEPIQYDDSFTGEDWQMVNLFARGGKTRINQVQDITPVNGGPVIGAVYVQNAPIQGMNGYWTTGGRKISDKQLFREASLAAQQQRMRGQPMRSSDEKGRPVWQIHDPSIGPAGAMITVPGGRPFDQAGVRPARVLNLATGTTENTTWEALGTNEQGNTIKLATGDLVKPIASEDDVYKWRRDADRDYKNDLLRLDMAFQAAQRSTTVAEMLTSAQMMGMPTGNLPQKKDDLLRWMEEWMKGQKEELAIHYADLTDRINERDGKIVPEHQKMGYMVRVNLRRVPTADAVKRNTEWIRRQKGGGGVPAGNPR